MKRLIAAIIATMLMTVSVAMAEIDLSGMTYDELAALRDEIDALLNEQEATDNEAAERADGIIVDSDTITAEFLGFDDNPGLGMFTVNLRVTNKTEQPIWVYMDKASVNDEMMQMVMTGVPLYIDPGKIGSNSFIFYYKQTSIEKFEDVKEVSIILKVDNKDTMNEIWTSPEVTLTK